MSYPRSMYKGDYDKPTELVVNDEASENAAIKDGYQNGHVFYSPKPEPVAETPTNTVSLESMNKAELVDHAAEVHGLELDHSSTKAELIAQIEAAQTPEQKSA